VALSGRFAQWNSTGWLDPKQRRRAIGAAVAILSALTLAAVVFAEFKPASPAKPTSGFHTYSVKAVVEIQPDVSTDICMPMINLVYPAQKCPGTIPLRIDVASLPRDQTLQSGTIWTPVLELTGTWTGNSLVVKSPPKRATNWSPIGMPGVDSGNAPNDATDSMLMNQKRLLADDANLRDKGIWILGSGWSKAGFFVILVAGDKAQLDYVKTTYKADVVSSWFRLVS